MVFCLLLLAMVGIVGFFQFVQGFFSATISAILCLIAATVALGWYEQAALLFNAKMPEQAASISLVVIFAAAYFLPRLVIDSFVPGNVRVPFIVEKVGAGVMGLIAGLIATGIVAIAGEALPFGQTVGMYARFATADQTGEYAGQNGVLQDTKTFDVLTGEKFDPNDPTKARVWFAMDDLTVGLANKVTSETGSLANDRPLAAVHPDLIDEYYGQRLGIQVGAKHTAVNTDQIQPVTVKDVYTPPRPVPQVDGEITTMRNGAPPPPATVTADGDQIVLVVRMGFTGKYLADDADGIMRYSAGSFRLVTGEPDNGAPMQNYYPVATLDTRGTAVACRADDFLLSELSTPRTIDFVFVVDRDHVMSGDETKPPFHLPSGAFVEFKRYGVVDLSGKQVEFGPPPNSDKTPVIRKPAVDAILAKTDGLWTGAAPVVENSGSASAAGTSSQAGGNETPEAGPAASDHPLGDSGLSYVEIRASNKLAVPISCGTGNDSGPVQLSNGVGGELAGRKWALLAVSTDTPAKSLSEPQTDDVSELAVDPNNTLVQVQCTAPVSGSGSQMWAWGSRVSDFALADATGHTYPVIGVWATVQRSAEQYFVANYKNTDEKDHLQPIATQKGRPVNVWLAFEVPSGTPIAEIRFSAKTAVDNLNFKTP